MLVVFALVGLGWMANPAFSAPNLATVVTDFPEYAPGETVWITGAGFAAAESVTVQVTHFDGTPTGGLGHEPWKVKATGGGGFVTSWFVPFDDNLGELMLLTATGNTSLLAASTTFLDAPPSVSLEQMRNGSAASPDSPINWVGGNANSSNAHLNEKWSQAYRAVFTDFTVGDVVEFVVGYDITHSSKHAMDYLTYFDRINDPTHTSLYGHTQETIDPLAGVGALSGPVYGPIPAPPLASCSLVVPNPVGPAQSQPCTSFDNLDNDPTQVRMTLYGGTFAVVSPVTYDAGGDPTLAQSEARVRVKFTATSSTIVLLWGGHLASNSDWGAGNSAGGISGSPYHTRAKELKINGVLKNVGNQDRSLSADAVAPCEITLTCPANLTIQCGASTDPASTGTPTYTANVECGTITLTYSDSTSGVCPTLIFRKWTASGSGGTVTCTQTITVVDVTKPVLSGCPANATAVCSAIPAAATVTATDNCDATVTPVFSETSNLNGCGGYTGTITRKWVATDSCGNKDSCMQVITVVDNTAPVISALPGPSTIQCPAVPSFATPTALDACAGSVTPTFADVTTPGTCPQEYSKTRTWTAMDPCGNSSTASQTITVEDNTAPVISALPGPSTIQCPAVPSFATPTALDACAGSVTPTFADVTTPGTCTQEYSKTRTWTATDPCGNISTASQTITVEDNTAPVISALPGPSTIQCPAVPSFATPTASDACAGSVTPTFADVTTPGSCPQEYSKTRTWTATDPCGNSSTASQTIIVEDNTAPVISALPGPSTIQCPAVPSFVTPTALDACAGSVTPTFVDVTTPGSCPQEYSVTRTWTATDPCGNSSTKSQTINVEDNTAPVISDLPGPSTVECPAVPSFATPTALDACAGSVTPTFADVTTPGTCAQERSVTRTWTAMDPCGNSSTASQTINVEDNTAPVISALPSPSTVECPAVPSFATPTALDACAGSVTPTFADVTTPGTCPQEYSKTRTWTATDPCGNSSTASQTITVEDNTAPVISDLPGPSTIQCPAVPSFATPTALDACTGSVTPTFADVTTPGSCPQEYSKTRTWTATDPCGNSSTKSQTITVEDNTAPVISALPGPSTIQCPVVPSFVTPTALDACAGSVTPTFADVTTPGACAQEYSVTRTWTATDPCGNSSTASQTINVEDNTAPVISALPGPSTVECPAVPSFATPTALDACAGSVTPTFADVTTPGTCPQERSVTRTWTATDPCGNTSTMSQTINVADNTSPVISDLPGPSTVECPAVPSFATPTALDACAGSVTPTFADVTTPGTCPQEYSVTRTWTAMDPCGNSSTASQTINVEDNTAPVISALPGPSTIECPAVPSFATPTASDVCAGSVTPTFADVTTPGTCPQEYSVTRTWTAMDPCGNSSTASQTINVEDNTAPVISALPGPSTIECPAVPSFATPTASDVCAGSVTPTFADVTTPGTCAQERSVTRTWTATDPCGNSSTASQTINVEDNTAPVISALPGPSTIECPAVPSFATPTALDACAGSVTPTFADVTTPGTCAQERSVTRTWTATDPCGNSSTASQTITVEDNTAPVISDLPSPSTVECPAVPSFATPTALDACAGSVTPTFADVTTPGTCPQERSVTRTWTATDPCGNTSTKSQTINVADNTSPVCNLPVGPFNYTQCASAQFCLPVSATDICDPSVTCTVVSGPGTVTNGQWCYMPTVDQTVTVTIRCTDDCGNSCEGSFTVTFDINDPPVIDACPAPVDPAHLCNREYIDGGDGVFNLGDLVTGVAAAHDPEGGNLCYSIVSIGPKSPHNQPVIDCAGNFSWQTSTADTNDVGTWDICIAVRDACGAADTCCFQVKVGFEFYVSIRDESGTTDTISALNGQTVCVYINIGPGYPLGGIDLLLAYDVTAIAFLQPAVAMNDLALWEYFTYRTGANGNCSGSGCPSGLIHIIALADLDNGGTVHPPASAFGLEGNVVKLCFTVTTNRNFIGQCIPIWFFTFDCGDNILASKDGYTTFMAIGTDTAACAVNEKPGHFLIPNVHFCNAWICIKEPPDDRGDINLDGVANSVADAVLFSRYFIYGIDEFSSDDGLRQVQILATDVNDDGIVLTVADLVYLVRIVTGDASPFPPGGNPKRTPYQAEARAVVNVSANRVSVTTNSAADLGGAVFTFRYAGLTVGTPVLGNAASQMVMTSRADRGELRVLVAPAMGARGARINAGINEIVSIPISGEGTIELVSVEMSDAQGALLNTSVSKSVPAEYALLQNYPNPFNAGTVIQFSLKDATDWKLSVYNITGQTVRSFSGSGTGQVQISWDGTDNTGAAIASGIYFYRLETKAFTATKKMILMK